MVTGILTLGGAIGHAITFGASAILLNSGIGMREYLWDMMVFQNILFAFAFLSTIFLYKEKPDVPPSPVAEAKVEPLDVFQIFQLFRDNKNFRYLLIAFMLKQGIMNGFGLLISDLFTPFGYSAGYLATVGICFFGSGIIGTIIFSIIADRTHQLKAILMCLCFLVIVTLALVALWVEDVWSIKLALAFLFCTFSGVPFLP